MLFSDFLLPICFLFILSPNYFDIESSNPFVETCPGIGPALVLAFAPPRNPHSLPGTEGWLLTATSPPLFCW